MNRTFLLLFLGLLLALLGCSPDRGGTENVILVSIDTLRADRLGCYGYGRPTSPILDSFAESGALFERAVAPSPWTLPSHATLLTGFNPQTLGVVDREKILPEEIPTLASRLQEEGFVTGAVVNSFLLGRDRGFGKGFQTYEYIKEFSGNRGPLITQKAVDWLRVRHKKPFFLFLHYYDVHSDYTPKPEYRDKMAGPYDGIVDGTTEQLKSVRDGYLKFTEADTAHASDLYDGEILQLDSQLGKLIACLDRLGLDKNTLVIIVSDHGEEFMEHGSVLHGKTLYGEMLNVPLLMRGPGIPAACRVKPMAVLADLVPTILGRLGLEGGDSLDGMDLTRALEAPDDLPANRLAFACADKLNKEPDMLRMIQTRDYKLCYNRLTHEKELFHLAADPLEQKNLAREEPQKVEQMMKGIEKMLSGSSFQGATRPLSAEEEEQLRSLGY